MPTSRRHPLLILLFTLLTLSQPPVSLAILLNITAPPTPNRIPLRNNWNPIALAADVSSETLTGGPLITGCWNVAVQIESNTYNCQIDSGSSDLLIPGANLNGYVGPSYSTAGKRPLTGRLAGAQFADGSAWTGYFYSDRVLVGGVLGVTAPFAVVTQQTSNPVFDGSTTQGLIGIAYDSLSTSNVRPATVLSAMSDQKSIASEVVSFRGCPANSASPSVVDWGRDNRNLTCSSQLGWAQVADASHFSVDVIGISVGSKSLPLPTVGWQAGANGKSLVDSCTTILYLPQFVHNELIAQVRASGAFNGIRGLSETNLNNFLFELYSLPATLPINYTALPTLSFTLLSPPPSNPSTTPRGNLTLTLLPQNYIQQDNQGNIFFALQPQSTQSVVMGATVFTAFYVVFDRRGGRVGFGEGCGCAEGRRTGVLSLGGDQGVGAGAGVGGGGVVGTTTTTTGAAGPTETRGPSGGMRRGGGLKDGGGWRYGMIVGMALRGMLGLL
ncbi:Beta-secretase 2 [Chytridiales sp. JEL 0842]|nr:Beta-secretase 2 [Chytridiales sp. JEL 0842]